jgi:hypothetical protein
MGKFQYILLASVLLAVAFAAPKEESDSTEVAEKKAEKKSSTDERSVDVINEDWGTYLANNYGGIAVSGVAVLLILGGLGYAFYHFYYVQYSLVGTGLGADQSQYGQPHAYPNYGTYPGQYSAYTGRSLDTSSPWNFTKVLEYIEIAQKTYEGFDWQDLECQKRTLCELVQKQNEPWGETGRKLANSYVYHIMDALDGVPIPQMIQTYLRQYKEAVTQGKNSSKDCGQVYSKCKFSIKDVLNKAAAKKKA